MSEAIAWVAFLWVQVGSGAPQMLSGQWVSKQVCETSVAVKLAQDTAILTAKHGEGKFVIGHTECMEITLTGTKVTGI